jgi:hypothetical protein
VEAWFGVGSIGLDRLNVAFIYRCFTVVQGIIHFLQLRIVLGIAPSSSPWPLVLCGTWQVHAHPFASKLKAESFMHRDSALLRALMLSKV